MLNKKVSYWPNNVKNLRTMIIKANKPNLDWPTFNIIKIFGFYDKYENALEMEKQAVKDSESESDAYVRAPGKRKSKQRSAYSPPPSFSGNYFTDESEDSSTASSSNHLTDVEEAMLNDVILLNNTDEIAEFVLESDVLTTVNKDTGENALEVISETNSTRPDSELVQPIIPENTREVRPEGANPNSNERLILDKLEEISNTMKFLLIRMNALEGTTSNSNTEFDFSGLPQLPLNSLDELLNLEELLQNEELKKKMLNKLFQVSGKTEADFVRRALATTFSNKLAVSCSWTGQKNNFKIKDCAIVQVIKGAVQKTFKVTTDKKFEVTMMDWFRHASQRLKRNEASK